MSNAASLTFLAHHEFRLAWRDWWSMLTAGKPHRIRVVIFAMTAFAIFMHLVAFSIVAKFAEIDPDADRGTLVVITGCALLAWSLMMSQAMELVTRAFYARSDLDLILSSPAASRRVFAVRIATMAASTVTMAVLLAAPFINILIWRGGARWLSAYGVVIAVGAVAAGLSVALTVALFRTIGPKRTRLAAQIVAAIVGATFVIGLQVAAILSYGTLSYFTFLKSDLLVSFVPAIESVVWWPARAVLGDLTALAAVLSAGALLLGAAIVTVLGALRRPRHRRRRRVGLGRGAAPLAERLSPGIAPRRAAAERMDAAPPRSLARLADADAASLSAAAGPDAVARLRQPQRRPRAAGAGAGDGGGPARRRPRLARHLRRGCARSRRHRADPGRLHRPRQDGSGHRQRRYRVRAVRHRDGAGFAARCAGRGGRHRRLGRVRHADPALVPHAGETQALPPPPDLVARRDLRGSVLLDLLGRDRGPRRGRPLAGGDHRADRARHSFRRAGARAEEGS